VKTQIDLSVAAGASVDLDRWQVEFTELVLRIAPRFARVEPRRRVTGFLRGESGIFWGRRAMSVGLSVAGVGGLGRVLR
jgi:hypothetical protein